MAQFANNLLLVSLRTTLFAKNVGQLSRVQDEIVVSTGVRLVGEKSGGFWSVSVGYSMFVVGSKACILIELDVTASRKCCSLALIKFLIHTINLQEENIRLEYAAY